MNGHCGGMSLTDTVCPIVLSDGANVDELSMRPGNASISTIAFLTSKIYVLVGCGES